MQLTIRLLRETDGRWIADISELPGVTVYGATPEEATLTHLLQLATQAGRNLLIPHKAMPTSAKS